jgi:hypothetical protein
MQEQQMAGKASMIGYAVGIAAVVVVVLWKVVAR